MRVACPQCQARYNVDDRKVPPGGAKVRCPKCQGAIVVRPPAADAAAFPAAPPPVPAAARPAPPAPVPLPAPEEATAAAAAEPPQPAPGATDPAAPWAPASVTPPPPVDLGTPPEHAPTPDVVRRFADALASGAGSADLDEAGKPGADPFAVDLAGNADPFAAAAPVNGSVAVRAPAEPIEALAEPEPPPARERAPEAAAPFPALDGLGPAEAQQLEALFDDTAAPSAAPRPTAQRPPSGFLHVRRRTGKVFGPFPEAEVARMLRDAELAGNEEISSDGGESWRPLSSVPALAGLARDAVAPAIPDAPVLGRKGARDEEETTDEERPRRGRPSRSAIVAIAGAALVLLGIGVGAGFTRYGFFFYKLASGQLGANRAGAALLAQARARLAEGGYAPLRAGLDLAANAATMEASDLEARALELEIAAVLERRHGGGAAALTRAMSHLGPLDAKAKNHPDTLKARLAAALVPGSALPLDALAALEHHAASVADADAELLLGEAAASKKDWAGAAARLAKASSLEPRSARGPHALGLVALATGDRAEASKRFEEALARDPKHLASALELAAMAVEGGDDAAAEQRLVAMLAEGSKTRLGPRERARARILRAGVLSRSLGAEPEPALAAAGKELEDAVADDPGYAPARVAHAQFLLRRGLPERALQALGPAASAAPELHARALIAAGRTLDASQSLDAALARAAGDARLVFVKGLVAEASGNHAEAEKIYADAASKDPKYVEPRLALGLSRLRAGDVAGAAGHVATAAQHAPGDAEVQVAAGEVAVAKGDVRGARAAFEKALALDPASASAHHGLARLALAQRDDAAAERLLARALRLDPRSSSSQIALGDLRWKRGDHAGAREAFAAAVAAEPKNALARTRLGAVELEAGQVDAALSSLLAATNADIRFAEARQWYGRALLARGETPQAVEQLRRAVDLDAATAANHLWLGVALEKGGDLAEAVEAYRAAAAREPRLVDARERLGQLFASQNRWEDAAAEYEKALAAAPREARLQMALGDAKRELGRHPEAVRLYRAVMKADPKQVGVYYRIARALHESSGIRDALPWYERAAQMEPRNPMPHYYLGFAYKDRGLKPRAIASFKAYLAAKPDAEDRKDIEREMEDLGARP